MNYSILFPSLEHWMFIWEVLQNWMNYDEFFPQSEHALESSFQVPGTPCLSSFTYRTNEALMQCT